ncbi:hypothetical protein LWI29_022762 [Acer saccharum]|uniref:Uncharacterized protein n=1 Tax=Acer saccharum TaxID=4024 RepID=A0AA39RMC7_ACESA|nr:hypothetical protein LWI29_022762 [Acer saccharum]
MQSYLKISIAHPGPGLQGPSPVNSHVLPSGTDASALLGSSQPTTTLPLAPTRSPLRHSTLIPILASARPTMGEMASRAARALGSSVQV